MTGLKSTSANELELTFKTLSWVIVSDKIDDLIDAIRTAYQTAFSGVPEKNLYKIEVKPDSRLKQLQIPGKKRRDEGKREILIFEFFQSAQSLGGFLATYKSCCDRDNIEPIPGIVWELENVAAKLNTKEFCLKEVSVVVENEERRKKARENGKRALYLYFSHLCIYSLSLYLSISLSISLSLFA
jgi:hypothetical protein